MPACHCLASRRSEPATNGVGFTLVSILVIEAAGDAPIRVHSALKLLVNRTTQLFSLYNCPVSLPCVVLLAMSHELRCQRHPRRGVRRESAVVSAATFFESSNKPLHNGI